MEIVEPVKTPRTDDPKELDGFFKILARRLSYIEYAGDPTGNVTPRWSGDWAINTVSSKWYRSYGTTLASWAIVT